MVVGRNVSRVSSGRVQLLWTSLCIACKNPLGFARFPKLTMVILSPDITALPFCRDVVSSGSDDGLDDDNVPLLQANGGSSSGG